VHILAALSYALLVVAFVLAAGVFLYGQLLASQSEARSTELASAQAAIDATTVENFIRLRDRLSYGKSLLASHTAFSSFFSSLERELPSSVRFTSLSLSAYEGGARIEGTGVAQSFNALAATSQAFAADGSIKDAVFSNIRTITNTVSFSLSARLDKKSIAFTVGETELPAPLPPAESPLSP
jgi:Tfp pilus assembly protein PilN